MTEPQNDNTPAPVPTTEVAAPASAPAPETPVAPVAPVAPAAPEVPEVPETPEAPVAPVEAGPEAAAPVKSARGVNRKKAALIAAGVAVVVLAGAGVWGATAIADADRTAPTAYWNPHGVTSQEKEEPGPVPANALSGKLLPLPSGFSLGPDLGGDGNNFFVSGEKAVEGFKEARKGLSSSERKKRDDMLADLKLKGLAGRSYTKGNGDMVTEVRIMQADPQALGTFSEVSKKLIDLMAGDRDAPKVDGFPDAKCSLLPVGEEKEEKIDSLYCVSVEGDVMVNFRAYGPKPAFKASDATAFLKNQLSHLKSPGESA
ncbi:hypothetical protein [Streptomyces sp. NPDC059874]|uniref:hypothetical protein n=1 Tax=Streptomyces sp. NPDC059874 TaxID=3346983 RepID=UPI003655EFC6